MPIDFALLETTAQNIRDKSNQLLELINFGKAGVVNGGRLGDIPFNFEQKLELKTQYQNLLAELKEEINSL